MSYDIIQRSGDSDFIELSYCKNIDADSHKEYSIDDSLHLPTKNTVLSVYPPWLCQIPTYQEYSLVILVYPPWLCQISTYQEYSLVSLPTLVVSDTYLPRIWSCQSTHPGCVRYLPTKNTVLLVYPPWLCQIPTYQEYSLVSLPTLVVSDTYLPRIQSC